MLFFVNRLRRPADNQVGNFHRAAQLRTMAAIIRATSYGIFGFIVFLQFLNLLGIPYQPLLASAGILGVAIGLGAQSIFKDMLNGIFILVEDQYNVGEIVNIAGLKGTVEDLSLRRTTLRDADGTLYIIPNSQIATVSNLSRDYSVATLNVSVDASANPDKVIALLADSRRTRFATTPPSRTSPSPTPSSSASTRSKAAPSPIPSRSAFAPTSATSSSANFAAASSSPSKKTASPSATIPPTCSSCRAPNPTAPPAQQPLIGS